MSLISVAALEKIKERVHKQKTMLSKKDKEISSTTTGKTNKICITYCRWILFQERPVNPGVIVMLCHVHRVHKAHNITKIIYLIICLTFC